MQRFVAFELCGTFSYVDKDHQISSIIAGLMRQRLDGLIYATGNFKQRYQKSNPLNISSTLL